MLIVLETRVHRWLAVVLVGAFACGGQQSPSAGPSAPGHAGMAEVSSPDTNRDTERENEATRGVDDLELRAILADHWNLEFALNPLWATTRGDHRFDDKLADRSAAAIEASLKEYSVLLKRAKALEVATLSSRDVVTHRLFVGTLVSKLETAICQRHLWEVSTFNNPVSAANLIPEQHKIRSVLDADNLLARYRLIPQAIDRAIANLRIGFERGLFANAESVRRTIVQIDAILASPLDTWALMEPISSHASAKAGLSGERGERWKREIKVLVDGDIRSAFTGYRDFLKTEIMPRARGPKEVGIGHLSLGRSCYAAQIARHLGVVRPAEELHQLGISEVARVNDEMRQLGKKLFKTSELGKITTILRTDPSLYYEDSSEIVTDATVALAAAKAKIASSFGLQPRADCVVTPMPDFEAPFSTIAYYRPPHKDGGVPGQFFVNTYKPSIRPRFEMKVLTFHESIPGHHLQIAISLEQDKLPAFRRNLGSTAFVEGWALYTERLAEEMGLYKTDLDRMGMLSYDAWRASRLVVDTGLHHRGWTRDQAEEYLREHTALTGSNISNEVDRYISWPGQALAYKFGQLEILRLRKLAQDALGENFDIKAFHDVVLGGGAVTLPVLADRIEGWIARTRIGPQEHGSDLGR